MRLRETEPRATQTEKRVNETIEGPPALEIRCCCDPSRLYGTLRLNGEAQMGQRLRYGRIPNADTVADLNDIRPLAWPGDVIVLEVDVLNLRGFRVSLELANDPVAYNAYLLARPPSHLALKYHGDDRTFEEKAEALRGLPGFEPSPEVRALLPDVFP